VTARLPRQALGSADEAAVVALAMGSDDDAYGELVRRRQEQIRQLLRRLCHDAALADDLAQQTFVQGWRTMRTLKAPGAFGAWLRKLAVNVWLQHVRAAGSRLEGAHADPLPEELWEVPVAEQLDLDAALAQLPAPVRMCIVLAYAEHMSHREISEVTALPLGTVKSHIARGAARLRELLRAYGEQHVG
jgi:RNA polymerase sigma-70 factor (ECF subfamily)